jgi:hypothetical protein
MQQDMLTHIKSAMSGSYWGADGSRLSPETGEKVFVELSQAADLAQKIKMQQGSQVSDSMDLATSAMLSIIEHAVLNEMKNDTDYIAQVTYNVPLNENSNSKFDNLFAKNEALKLAVRYYSLTVREPDLSKSAQIVDNFRLAWLNTIKGMNEVSSQNGITPPSPGTNTTTPTKKVNSTGPSNATSSTGGKTQQGTIDLSGIWSANDGGTYYIKQLDNTVWWLGMSENNGESFTNVFKGIIKDNSIINGEWIDVPKGATRNHGTLLLNISNNEGTQLKKMIQTGGFGVSLWSMSESESMSSSGVTTGNMSEGGTSIGQTTTSEGQKTHKHNFSIQSISVSSVCQSKNI